MAPRKGGLGKGLDSLFMDNMPEEGETTRTLRISELEPNRDQPRKEFDPAALAELADSIAAVGIIQPLIVRPLVGGGYQIVAGERRWRAAQSAGLTEVPVVVRDFSDKEVAEIALIENLQREDLNPVEEAEGYRHLMSELGKMIENADAGKLIRDGVDTVIVGKPNVGKSTLMNCLSGCERSIVTHVAGTTRDIVEEKIVIGDVILRLADTAGIHEANDLVEEIGIQRAFDRMNTAGLILAVFDNSQPLDENDLRLLQYLKGRPCVAVINKNDMDNKLELVEIQDSIPNVVYISAKNESGIDELSEEISKLLGVATLNPADGILSGERQINCCINSRKAVKEAIRTIQEGLTLDAVGVCLDFAINSLLELTGERVTNVVADAVFHQFCVGK